jgi:hypothetical protein
MRQSEVVLIEFSELNSYFETWHTGGLIGRGADLEPPVKVCDRR